MARVPVLRIGTRGSPLALAQARQLRDRLAEAHPELAPEEAVELAVIRTTGDKLTGRPLREFGGKGLFTKEIEEALLAGRVDLAVHSMKDVPTWLPEGLEIACLPPREDPRDAFVCHRAATIAGLPQGAVVGTASLRRRAQLLALRPDLEAVDLRGNVHTRLRKVKDGQVDATLLALAGLKRLGIAAEATAVLSVDEILPAVGQGAIGVECRGDDTRVRDLLAPLNDPATAACVAAERAMLAALDGSCRTPIAGLAELDGSGGLALRGLLARPDGSEVYRVRREGRAGDAVALGTDAGAELKARAGPGFIESLG
ncbi:MAG: hydroxymethylbilane synthase [Alphaproteobacteria bacterium]